MHSFEVSLGYESVDRTTFFRNYLRIECILLKFHWGYESVDRTTFSMKRDSALPRFMFGMDMKWSHDYKSDVSRPNEAQIRTCTCLHDDVRCNNQWRKEYIVLNKKSK
jgi:hypothetical protein